MGTFQALLATGWPENCQKMKKMVFLRVLNEPQKRIKLKQALFCMLVMGMGILDILVAYEQLWRSLGYRGGPKTPPKTLKNIKKGYKKVYIEKLTQNDPFFLHAGYPSI